MSKAKQAIESGLDLYRELLGEDEALEAELVGSRAEFWDTSGSTPPPAGGGTPEAILADRRHLEWFLLERPSQRLEGVPAEALQDAWFERAPDSVREHAAAFLQSIAGAFEVTGTEPGRGIWVADLFAAGEVPIEETEAAPELQTGDLLVGRLFPIGDGVFRLSPAVACFRNPRLLEAVREDLERMRESRRGVLRIQQLELEHLFFPALEAAPPTPEAAPEDPGVARARIHAELVAAGLEAADASEILEVAAQASETPGLMTDIMNQLAFDTDADLERARVALAELWALEQAQGPTAVHASPQVSAQQGDPDSAGDARTALEEFDRGRAEGRDLDQLFQELAANLGVEAPTDDGEDAAPPDFPGVMGAMVEEFLWDIGREKGEPTAERFAGLRRLSEYGKDIGVFENVGQRELIDFAGRWLLDEGRLVSTEETRALFDALEEFCRWCEERHAHELWSASEKSLERLRRDVPRLLVLRQRSRAGEDEDSAAFRPYRVLAVEGTACQLADDAGQHTAATLPADLRDLLQPGDVLHATLPGDGELVIRRAYPAELEQLMSNRAD